MAIIRARAGGGVILCRKGPYRGGCLSRQRHHRKIFNLDWISGRGAVHAKRDRIREVGL